MVRIKETPQAVRKYVSGKQTYFYKTQESHKIERYRPAALPINEMELYRRSIDLIIPKIQFQRLVKEITNEICTDLKFQVTALATLQQAAEAYLIGIFEVTNVCITHAGRVTMLPKDLQLAMRICAIPLRCKKTEKST